ncbi:MAG: CapA family protein [Acetatifactor sp.]|nr:CapA family protein [Acetatifactor sp.]
MKKRLLWIFFLLTISLTGCGKKAEQSELSQQENETAVASTEENKTDKEYAAENSESLSVKESAKEGAEEPPSCTIIMVGDILLHTPVENAAKREDGTYDFSAIFENTKGDINAADLAIVNQEVIIGGEELGVSGYPAFNAPFEIGDALVEAGFDVVCHGTNHALDKGKKGIVNCLEFWRENYPDIGVIGIYDSEEAAEEIYVKEVNGIKIAILNYTYSTNGIEKPADMPFAVNMLTEKNKESIIEDIKEAEEIADFTVVCPHWGVEYNTGVSADQSKWTEVFLENGVDLVLGTHPHVIEPIEIFEDEETGRQMPVYYSLGNFVNWTSGTGEGVSNRMVGGMAKICITKTDPDAEAKVKEADVVPLVCHVESGRDGVTVYRLEDYSQELAEKNEIINQAPDFSYDYCINLVENIWPLYDIRAIEKNE